LKNRPFWWNWNVQLPNLGSAIAVLPTGIPLHIFDRGKKAEHGDEEEDHGQ
jgi:hypothetical protein